MYNLRHEAQQLKCTVYSSQFFLQLRYARSATSQFTGIRGDNTDLGLRERKRIIQPITNGIADGEYAIGQLRDLFVMRRKKA